MVEQSAVQYARTEDGVNIAYTLERNGSGTPVMVVLSPMLGSALDEPLSNSLSPLFDGRTVIRLEPRCHGLSDRNVEDVSLAARELDLRAVQNAAGVERVAIQPVGQDVWPSISYASHHPESVSHLLLTWPSSSGDEFWNGTVFGQLRHLVDTSWEAFTEALAWLSLGQAGSTSERVLEVAARHRASVSKDDFLRLWEADLAIDVSEELERLTCDVLVMGDSESALLRGRDSARNFAVRAPKARFISSTLRGQFREMATLLDDAKTPMESEAQRAELPPGLRSILFTDIEGHTEMMARLGDERGREVLREHERITRGVAKSSASGRASTPVNRWKKTTTCSAPPSLSPHGPPLPPPAVRLS